MSGPDLRRRPSEENLVSQEPQGEVQGAFEGQTELHQEQASGPTQVSKDETTAHLSEGPVLEEAQDINNKVEEEHKTIVQEAQKGSLEHLNLTDIKAGLEGATHTIISEFREEAQDAKGQLVPELKTMTQEIQTGVERMNLKSTQEGPEGITHLTEHSESKEGHDIKYQQKEPLPLRIDVDRPKDESKLKCFLFL